MYFKKALIVITCILLSACATEQTKMSQQEMDNLHTALEILNRPHHLKPTHYPKCVSLSKIKSIHTPPDLFNAAQRCFESKQYDKGAMLIALAGTRAHYDTFRIKDKSAHIALPMLMKSYFSNPKYSKDKKVFEAILNPSPNICDILRKSEIPNYIPHYMISSGRSSSKLENKSDALVPNISEHKNWELAVKKNKPCGVNKINTQGNLTSKHNLNCISLDQINSNYTPADLYPSAAKCFKSDNSGQGFELFMAASLYSRYDMLRITDKSAWQAKNALIMKHIYPLPKSKKVPISNLVKRTKTDKQFKRELCSKLKSLPIPTYTPDYMINHGMGAVLKGLKAKAKREGKPLPNSMNISNKSSLKEKYNPSKLWEESLKKSGLC
jgi:hypothetical protein